MFISIWLFVLVFLIHTDCLNEWMNFPCTQAMQLHERVKRRFTAWGWQNKFLCLFMLVLETVFPPHNAKQKQHRMRYFANVWYDKKKISSVNSFFHVRRSCEGKLIEWRPFGQDFYIINRQRKKMRWWKKNLNSLSIYFIRLCELIATFRKPQA